MANKDLKEQEKLQQEALEQRVSKTEQFYNENKKTIWGVFIAVIVVALAILAYTFWILKPAQAEAQEQMVAAETAFAQGNYETALNGDGNALGFKDVIDQYKTKGGKSVYFYAGVSALQLGQFEDAINYLKKYDGKDEILAARAIACIGDAYVGLEKNKEAVAYFEKAAAAADNMFAASYLLKAGIAYEELGDDAKALACYKSIKDKYPQSVEGYDIDKYITRIETK